jgi:spermidine synthase
MWPFYVGLFLLSTAGLSFEVTLTRVFSLAQWYHFAFMAVSVALLGFGASGSALTLFPPSRDPTRLRRYAARAAVLFSFSVLASFLSINFLPFDSYRIAWERVQVLYMAVYFLALALPFFFNGLLTGGLLTALPERTGHLYAANLLGSAMGCVMALIALPLFGGAGTILLSAAAGMLAATLLTWGASTNNKQPVTYLLVLLTVTLTILTLKPPAFLEIRLSPYKGLSYALQYPDATVRSSRWNAFSRVDVVESRSIRSAPGLSLRSPADFPAQHGLYTDGDLRSAITDPATPGLYDFLDHLPVALPYRLRPGASVLILEPGGGLDALLALREGAGEVVAVESNPLAVRAVDDFGGRVYQDACIRVVNEDGRAYVRRHATRYDLIHLSLNGGQRPVVSGAYSLAENYLYTVEAFDDYLAHLNEGGLLVVSRWLQLPPSESLRAWALAVTALERADVPHPERQLIAIRSWATSVILVKNGEFTAEEIATVKAFCEARDFDLVYYPGIRVEEANRYSVVPGAPYYCTFHDLLFAADRAAFYRTYPYDVRPPTDDRPFFFHFFKWSQTPQILQALGKTWQPFGGSGYFVLVALLALALVASVGLILLPLALRRKRKRAEGAGSWKHRRLWAFAYFTLLGLGYLFVEIPLMQRFILFLGHPAYAFATVLFSLLLFSGIGSLLARRFRPVAALALLCGAILIYPALLPIAFRALLGWPLAWRLVVAAVGLAPLGLLMGVPFPTGVAALEARAPDLIPWAWAINGCASVLASILAAMLALSWGFWGVLLLAVAAYAGGLVAIVPLGHRLRTSAA